MDDPMYDAAMAAYDDALRRYFIDPRGSVTIVHNRMDLSKASLNDRIDPDMVAYWTFNSPEKAKDFVRTKLVRAVMEAIMPTPMKRTGTFPFMHAARDLGIPYSQVLLYADMADRGYGENLHEVRAGRFIVALPESDRMELAQVIDHERRKRMGIINADS